MSALFAVFVVAATVCQTPLPPPAPRCIAIVGSNDVHGAIEPETHRATLGGESVRGGGVMATSGYLRAMRQKYGDKLVVLDAGDIFQGSMASNLSRGKAMIVAYNALGYDAAAIGNHEFDFGAEAPLSPHAQAEAQGIDLTGALKSRIAEANFPFLAVNIDDKATGTAIHWPNVRPSLLKQVGGVTVGIIGASTPETPFATRAQNVAHLSFVDPAPRIVAEAKRLRHAGAELVILVAHMGGVCDLGNTAHTLQSCNATPGKEHELIDVLTAMPEGTIDVAVGGHTHQFMAHWLGGTAVIESGSRGEYLGLVEACVTQEGTGRPRIDPARSSISQPIPVCLTTWEDGTCQPRAQSTTVRPARLFGLGVEPETALMTKMAPFLTAVQQAMDRSLGAYLPEPLSTQAVGALTAEAMRRQMRSDFGLHNAGGVRMGLGAGPLTYGRIFESLPFDNYVQQISITGREVVALAKILAATGSRGRVTQFANLKILGEGAQQVVVDAKGRPLDPAKRYTLSTTDFVVEGGDGAIAVLEHLDPRHIVASEVSARDAAAGFIGETYSVTRAP